MLIPQLPKGGVGVTKTAGTYSVTDGGTAVFNGYIIDRIIEYFFNLETGIV